MRPACQRHSSIHRATSTISWEAQSNRVVLFTPLPNSLPFLYFILANCLLAPSLIIVQAFDLHFAWSFIPTVLAYMNLAFNTMRRYFEQQQPLRMPEPGDFVEDARIVCVASPDFAQQYGPISCDPFEPRVFSASLALIPLRPILLSAIPCIIFVYMTLQFTLPSASLLAAAGVAVFCGPYLAYVVIAFAFPRYIRITPGRLEILHASLISHNTKLVKVIDLHNGLIHLNVRGRSLYITNGNSTEVIPFGLFAEPVLFAYFVLRGALTPVSIGCATSDQILC